MSLWAPSPPEIPLETTALEACFGNNCLPAPGPQRAAVFWGNLALPSVEKKVHGSWLQLATMILQRRRRRDTHSFCYCFFRGNVLVHVWARGQPRFISQSSMKLPGSESIGTLRLLPAHACNRSCCFHCAAGWGGGAPGWGDAAGLTLQPGCYGLITWNRAPPRHVREMKGAAPPLPPPRDDRGERRPDPSGHEPPTRLF